jgi:CO/xanthine dehydrogenase Mo-binding subunit
MSFLTSREQVAAQGIGKPVRRREDARLLIGGGRFADETNLPGQGYACMVRSPHAHALIASIDTGPAEGMPGVIAVLTGSDASGPNLGRALPLLGPRRGRAYLARSLSAPGHRGGKGGRGRSMPHRGLAASSAPPGLLRRA